MKQKHLKNMENVDFNMYISEKKKKNYINDKHAYHYKIIYIRMLCWSKERANGKKEKKKEENEMK